MPKAASARHDLFRYGERVERLLVAHMLDQFPVVARIWFRSITRRGPERTYLEPLPTRRRHATYVVERRRALLDRTLMFVEFRDGTAMSWYFGSPLDVLQDPRPVVQAVGELVARHSQEATRRDDAAPTACRIVRR